MKVAEVKRTLKRRKEIMSSVRGYNVVSEEAVKAYKLLGVQFWICMYKTGERKRGKQRDPSTWNI